MDPAHVPDRITLPRAVAHHYRALAWVEHEQRLVVCLLAALFAGCGLIWLQAARLAHKPALLVRAGPSLAEAAARFRRSEDVPYDQLAFFLNGCVPLLYADREGGHPLLPLAEGVVAPEICREAEQRLSAHAPERAARAISQFLALETVTDVIVDAKAGRAAARLRGRLVVTARGAPARELPWAAHAVLAVNPGSRLDPYPFYLVLLQPEGGS